MAAAGATGLLVWGQAQQTLRGHALRTGTAHFWIGIALALVTLLWTSGRLLASPTDRPRSRAPVAGAVAVLAFALAVAQGYLGGRMTYGEGVGLDAGGQLAQSARGAARLEAALARGTDPVAAGRAAFSTAGLGCASCHGDRAQGQRGPRLAGGRHLPDFRRVHAGGLFPPTIVTDRDFAALDAYLATLGPRSDSD
jgi:mono/diheme cytochrome c family protein